MIQQQQSNNMNSSNNKIIKKILISGSSGFLGQGLIRHLQALGIYDIYTLVRRPVTGGYEIEWDAKSIIDTQSIETIQPDIVIHLSGENVMGYWNETKKKKILDSRTKSTKLLCDTLASCKHKPELFISASGCTYYGSDVYHPVDEFQPKGKGFFSDVVEKWEKSADSLKYAGLDVKLSESSSIDNLSSISMTSSGGLSQSTSFDSNLNKSTDSYGSSGHGTTRMVYLRIGLVLDPSGGFLSTIYYPFKFALGAVIGSGNQWIPWISLRDTCYAIQFILENQLIEGPVNLTNPNPITNSNFTRTLGYVLNRPTIFWVPEFLVKLVLGKEMANETILSSQRVIPTKLLKYGYSFKDFDLYDTLKYQLSRNSLQQQALAM